MGWVHTLGADLTDWTYMTYARASATGAQCALLATPACQPVPCPRARFARTHLPSSIRVSEAPFFHSGELMASATTS